MRGTLRRAGRNDIDAIEQLLAAESLPTTPVEPYLDSFSVLDVDGVVSGCAGIEMYGDAALLRSVVITPAFRGRGLGDSLVAGALDQAKQTGARRVYLFTMHASNFFSGHGFKAVAIEDFEPAVRSAPQYVSVSQTPQIAELLTAMRLDLS